VDAKHAALVRPVADELNLGLILMDPDRLPSPSPQQSKKARMIVDMVQVV
jgi:hypothetical protein